MLTLNVRLEDGYALNQDIMVTCLTKSHKAFNCGTKPSTELISSVSFFSKVTFYILDQKQEQVKLLCGALKKKKKKLPGHIIIH